MPHWKSMMDRDFIFAFDLNGKDVTVTIAKVEAGNLVGEGGRKSKKPVVYFEGKEKGLALNVTNSKTIAALYTDYTEKWVGKQITLFPTTTTWGGKTVECIRVRPNAPRNGRSAPTAPEKRDADGAPLRERLAAELARARPDLGRDVIEDMDVEGLQAEIALGGKP